MGKGHLPLSGTEKQGQGEIKNLEAGVPHVPYDADRIIQTKTISTILSSLPTQLINDIDINNNIIFCELVIRGLMLDLAMHDATDVLIRQVYDFKCQLYCHVTRFIYNTARFVLPYNTHLQ
jgi:hypothetical protein